MSSCTLNRGGCRSEWTGTTGTQFEDEFVVIGRVQVTWNGVYIPYRPAMDEIRSRQAPNSALGPEGLKLRDEVARQMCVDPVELLVFASTNTCLDKKHGVDLFIVHRGATVTIDLTMNSQKESYKADVIVTPDDVSNGYALAADRIRWAFRNQSRPTLRA